MYGSGRYVDVVFRPMALMFLSVYLCVCLCDVESLSNGNVTAWYSRDIEKKHILESRKDWEAT